MVSHIARESKVFVIVDSDCDGYTSSALLINYLNNLFPGFVQNNISYSMHTGKQHGIILDMIPEDVGLVICPDSASADYEQHEELKKRGIEKLKVIYSTEEAMTPVNLGITEERDTAEGRRSTPGSNAFVPATAGLLIGSEVVKALMNG